MKKKSKIIFIISIAILLLVILSYFLFSKNQKDTNKCESIDLKEILNDVNDFYINEFDILNLDFQIEIPNILVNITSYDEMLYASSIYDSNEYFVIFRGLSEDKINLLKEQVNLEQEKSNKYYENSKVVLKNDYTYIVASLEKTSIIEGIIESNIYCNNN